MEYYYSGTESLWCGNWNHLVCRRSKCAVDHPSQSTVVNLGKKQKWCSLRCPWSQVQQDTSGPVNFQILSCLLVPYRLAGGLLICSLSVPQSVSQSVRHTSVFRTFLCRLLEYWFEIWNMNLSWQNTDQVWVSSRLAYFHGSYCTYMIFRELCFFQICWGR